MLVPLLDGHRVFELYFDLLFSATQAAKEAPKETKP